MMLLLGGNTWNLAFSVILITSLIRLYEEAGATDYDTGNDNCRRRISNGTQTGYELANSYRTCFGVNLTYNSSTSELFCLAFVFLALTSIFAYISTDCANSAYVEGMAGFQVLRRNCHLESCDTTQERNFIHSLIVSYAPNNPIQISANGYSAVNRSLISVVMVNVMGYLVAAYTLKLDTTQFWTYGRYANLYHNSTCAT